MKPTKKLLKMNLEVLKNLTNSETSGVEGGGSVEYTVGGRIVSTSGI